MSDYRYIKYIFQLLKRNVFYENNCLCLKLFSYTSEHYTCHPQNAVINVTLNVKNFVIQFKKFTETCMNFQPVFGFER